MKKLLAVLMSLAIVLAYTPMPSFAETKQVTDQDSFNDVVAVANAGDVIEITTAGEYKIPNIPNNITIEGVDGVVFDCVGSGSIASIPNGATFKNVAMNFGKNSYHGFQHAGTINMEGCTLNGLLFSYGDMNFNECTFNAPGTDASGLSSADYSMWAYGLNLTYTDCIFNCAGKCINVYCERNTESYSVTAKGCEFYSTISNKAAFNVKETGDKVALKYNVSISDCKCDDNFPSPKEDGALKVISPLVQVDDIFADGTPAGGEIKVTLDGTQVYASLKAFAPDDQGTYHISTAEELVKFAGLVNNGTAASKDAVLDADIDLDGVDFTPIGTATSNYSGTFDGNGKTIKNLNVSVDSDYAGLFGAVFGATIKSLTLDAPVIKNTATDYTGAVAGGGYADIEDCAVSGGSVTGVEQVGSIIGYLSCGVVKGCTVDGTSVTGDDRVGGIVGKANVDSNYDVLENVIKNATIKGSNSAAIIGQIMTNQDKNHYAIKDNQVADVTVLDASGNDAFNPIGNIRSGNYDPNAVSGGKITGNSWSPMTSPNSYKMVNPADTTQYIVIKNANQPKVAKIGDTEYTSLQEALDDAVKGGDVTVDITADIDLSDTVWNPVAVTGSAGVVTVNGNNHIITGLGDMLFSKTWAGKTGLVINDLTIKDSAIVNDKNDAAGDIGVGAFVGYPEASETVTLSNCHLIDSSVEGGHWTGGLVGACAGYNGNDGPVFTTLTITGCSVEGCEIIGPGSAGSFIGHASQNLATKVILEGTAKNNKITGETDQKTGILIGTIGAAGGAAAFNGEKGGIELNAEESGNEGAACVAGRIGSAGGTMIVTGGSYTVDPTVTSDNEKGTIEPAKGYAVAENSGVYSLEKTIVPDDSGVYHITNADELVMLSKAVNSGKDFSGKTVVLDADIDLAGVTFTPIGSSSSKFGGTFDGNGKTIKNLNVSVDSNYAGLFGAVFGATIKNLTVKDATVNSTGENYTGIIAGAGYATIENCTVSGGTVEGTDQVGGIIGYLCPGSVKGSTVDSVIIKANGDRAGGIVGKAQPDNVFEISGNTVNKCTISAAKAVAGSAASVASAAGLVGQIMTDSSYSIKDNKVTDTTTATGSDTTFVPIGEFRPGKIDENAVTGGKIANNSWAPMTTPDSYKMVDANDTSKFVEVANAAHEELIAEALNENEEQHKEINDKIDGLDDTYATDAELAAKIAAAEKALADAKSALAKTDAELATKAKAAEKADAELTAKAKAAEKALADVKAALEKADSKNLAAAEKEVAALKKQLEALKKQQYQDKIDAVTINLTAKAKSYNSVKLTWNTSKAKVNNKAITYKVYYKKKSTKKWKVLTTKTCKADGKNMTFTKKKLTTGKKYQFKVVPQVTVGSKKYIGADSNEPTVKPVPAKATIKKLKSGKKKFTVTYKKVAGATGYQIKYRRVSMNKVVKKTAKGTKKTVKKLKAKKRYAVNVRAYKKVNGKKVYGAWSKTKYVTTKK